MGTYPKSKSRNCIEAKPTIRFQVIPFYAVAVAAASSGYSAIRKGACDCFPSENSYQTCSVPSIQVQSSSSSTQSSWCNLHVMSLPHPMPIGIKVYRKIRMKKTPKRKKFEVGVYYAMKSYS